jgi:hypothetical protein
MKHFQSPVLLRALGDETRALDEYLGLGLLTQEEAQERLSEWQLFYPAGWNRVVALVSARRHKLFRWKSATCSPGIYREPQND